MLENVSNPSYTQLLFVFFYIGIIMDFSDLAERKWLEILPIAYTEIADGVIHLAWGPIRFFIGWISAVMLAHNQKHWSYRNQLCYWFTFPILAWFLITFAVDETEKSNRFEVIALLALAEIGPVALLTVAELEMVEFVRRENQSISHTCRRSLLVGKAIGGLSGALLLYWYGLDAVFMAELVVLCAGLVAFTAMSRLATPSYETQKAEETVTESTKEDVEEEEEQQPSFLHYTPMLFMFVYMSIPYARNAFFYFSVGPLGIDYASFGAIKVLQGTVTFATTFLYHVLPAESTFGYMAVRGMWFMLLAGACRVFLSTMLFIPEDWRFTVYLMSVFSMAFGDGIISTHYVTLSSKMKRPAFHFTISMTLPTVGKVIRIGLDSGLMLYFNLEHDNFNEIHRVMFICYVGSLACLLLTCLLT